MSKDEIKAITNRVRELEERNKAFQKQTESLESDFTEILQILEKLSSTKSNPDSTEAAADYKSPPSRNESRTETTESTQRQAVVEGHGAVRDPDGNLRTFTAQSLMAEMGL
ncbi:hypothetical protein F4054_00075 [Candidatus Poribacteria bacterium]|nr:hypothetical protein [Candidatus Poribacteria bacterium]MYG07527.1 hypothetical protein [Candidatus Poribacteria bacterium]MYK20642.1 hypothetical protein [Candidatus Poribacteria bacterium]